ncbi:MAG: MmgE/PrpD family protein [Pseudonocardiaceae bacterium]|nr:MmgE/PrpD family protein [Pseudonocardiaceae bacterium]
MPCTARRGEDPSVRPAEFVRDLKPHDIPEAAVHHARRCLLDLAGVAIAGSETLMSQLVREHAVQNFAAPDGGVRLLADGRRASPVGAALAGAATIDSLDAHDGHDLTKGHAGAAVLPALLAFADTEGELTGAEFITRLVIGYEIGIRAGIALHATAPDYHTSGAWNALGCAAIGARSSDLDTDGITHALGIAEYHGPRSQMMRCIEHPTMVKDGSAWGATAGVSAVLLAARGFTGAPAATTMTGDPWDDLGSNWRIGEQYLKPYPVCRWAHPAVRAAIDAVRRHELRAEDVDSIEVITFDPATRLTVRAPGSTEQAQYSLPFSVALAVVHGRLDPAELTSDDPRVRRLAEHLVVRENPDFTRRFPAERLASVRLTLAAGRTVESPVRAARGGPDDPLSDAELRDKALRYAAPVLGAGRARHIHELVHDLPAAPDARPLLNALLSARESF